MTAISETAGGASARPLFVRWHDRDVSGDSRDGNAADRDLELAVEDSPHLSLGMGVLMNRCAGVEFPVPEGHGRRAEVASAPAGQLLADG
jgi:hypothetical protein